MPGQNNVVQTFPGAWAVQQLAFANIRLSLAGVAFDKFWEVSYTDSNPKEKGKGVSPYPMGNTIGDYTASGSITVQLAFNPAFQAIVASFSPNGNSLYDAFFNVAVSWQTIVGPNQNKAPVQTHDLFHCALGGAGVEASHGAGVVGVKYPLDISFINWNGFLPIAGLQL